MAKSVQCLFLDDTENVFSQLEPLACFHICDAINVFDSRNATETSRLES